MKNVVQYIYIPMLFIFANTSLADMTWWDGQQHTIDYYLNPQGTLSIMGNFQTMHSTTAILVENGHVAGNVAVGSFGILNMQAGYIQNNLFAHGDAGTINISGGTVGGDVEVTGISSLHVTSATIDGNIFYQKTYQFSLTDSIVHGNVTASCGSISNTTINGYFTAMTSGMSITGCDLNGGIEASSLVSLNIINSGLTGNILAKDSAFIRIVGKDFKINNIDFISGYLSGSGHLTGVSNDGHPIDAQFSINNNGSIFLVPEPSTCLVLFSGSSVLLKKSKFSLKHKS